MMPTAIRFCHPAFQRGKFALCSSDVTCNSKVDTAASRTLLNLAEDEAVNESREMLPFAVDVARRNSSSTGASMLDAAHAAAHAAASAGSVFPAHSTIVPLDASFASATNMNDRMKSSCPPGLLVNPSLYGALNMQATMPNLYDDCILLRAQQQQHFDAVANQLSMNQQEQRSLMPSQNQLRQFSGLNNKDPSSSLVTLMQHSGGAHQQFPQDVASSMLAEQQLRRQQLLDMAMMEQQQQHLQYPREGYLAQLDRANFVEQKSNMSCNNSHPSLQQDLMLLEMQRNHLLSGSRNLAASQQPAAASHQDSQNAALLQRQMNLTNLPSQYL